jgi:hydroxyacylglutathione hydrolase
MKRVNQAGPPLLKDERALRLPSIEPAAAAALAADGALILDLRTGAAFAEGHPTGALNLPYGPKIGYWAGWVVPPDAALLLLAEEPAHAREAAMQLLRVDLDRIEGTIGGGFDAWTGAGLPVAQIGQISVETLRAAVERREAVRVVDVRTPREWRGGHIDGSVNIPVGEIPARARGLPRDLPVATICEGGYRSSLAASLLAHAGVPRVMSVAGGMAAYRALETV